MGQIWSLWILTWSWLKSSLAPAYVHYSPLNCWGVTHKKRSQVHFRPGWSERSFFFFTVERFWGISPLDFLLYNINCLSAVKPTKHLARKLPMILHGFFINFQTHWTARWVSELGCKSLAGISKCSVFSRANFTLSLQKINHNTDSL